MTCEWTVLPESSERRRQPTYALPAPHWALRSLRRMGRAGVQSQRLAQGRWVAAEGMIWFLPDEQIREPEQTSWKRVAGGID
jgi:hypothetical protein